MPQARTALLVGCGSIGIAHLEQLVQRYNQIVVVDPNPQSLSRAEQVIAAAPRDTVAGLLPDLETVFDAGGVSPDTVAVVANWGPDHLKTMSALFDAGVRTVLLEKPVADSVDDARGARTIARDVGANLWVNFTRRFSGFPEHVDSLSQEFDLGPVQTFTVVGGARCLATMGIHFLDLAQVIFGSRPSEVVADVTAAPLNPRSPDLLYYEGVMSYTFSEGKRFSCIYSNHVGLREVATLHWRDAVGTYSANGRFEVAKRPDKESELSIPITRATSATQPIFEGPVNLRFDGRTGLQFVHDGLAEGLPGYDGGETTEMLLAALHASAEGRRLSLPLDGSVDTAHHWRIS